LPGQVKPPEILPSLKLHLAFFIVHSCRNIPLFH
jgi:hypothetical protein